MLTAQEIAEKYNYCVGHVQRCAQRGDFDATKKYGRWYIDALDAARFFTRRTRHNNGNNGAQSKRRIRRSPAGYISTKSVAKLLKIRPESVATKAQKGHFGAIAQKIDGEWRFEKEAITEFAQKHYKRNSRTQSRMLDTLGTKPKTASTTPKPTPPAPKKEEIDAVARIDQEIEALKAQKARLLLTDQAKAFYARINRVITTRKVLEKVADVGAFLHLVADVAAEEEGK